MIETPPKTPLELERFYLDVLKKLNELEARIKALEPP
jgi:hypothetical protein